MESADERAELELRDYLDVVQRRWKLIALALVVVAGVALVASMTQTPRYRATTEVLVRQPPTAGSLDAVTGVVTVRSLANEVRLAKGSVVLDGAREIIGSEPTLDVQSASDADVLDFTAESESPELAALAADTYATSFVAERRESLVAEYLESGALIQELAAEAAVDIENLPDERAASEAALSPPVGDGADPASVAAYEAELARIAAEYDRRLANLEAQRVRYQELLDNLTLSAQLAQGSGAQVIRPAVVPTTPFVPTTTRNMALAIVVGLVLGIGAAFLVEHLDTSLRTAEELEAASGGLPTLSTIPELTTWRSGDRPHIISLEQPESISAESYRGLLTSVQFLRIDRTISTIAFTSAGPGEGKTTTATNLAVVAARSGQRVVLVDCDLRKPRVHAFFGLPNTTGFTTLLLGESSLDVAAQRPSGLPGLVVIPSGPPPPHPSELLAGKRARSLIASIASQADLVIIDAPPVLAVSDPRIIAGFVDGMILVASAHGTDRNHVARALEHLRLVDAALLGTVLNRQVASATTYGYGYGEAEGESPGTKRPRRGARDSAKTSRRKRPSGKVVVERPREPFGGGPPEWGDLPGEFTRPRR